MSIVPEFTIALDTLALVCRGDQLWFVLAAHLRLQFSISNGSRRVNGPMINIPQQQIPGVYHRRVGDIVVTAISDGFLDGSMRGPAQHHAWMRPPASWPTSFRPARRTSVNAFLIHSAGRLALIDTGSGNYLLPTAGKVLANIKAAGVDPASIDTVILTHMHPDHSAGLTDRTTGQRYFPNAELVMHESEPVHWFDDANMAKGTDREKRDFLPGRARAGHALQGSLASVQGGRGVSGRHRHSAPRPHAGPHHLHDQLRQGAAPDLGRHRPRARGADGAAGGLHGLRHRQGARGGLAPQGVRHGRRPTGCSSPACTCISRASPIWCATVQAIG